MFEFLRRKRPDTQALPARGRFLGPEPDKDYSTQEAALNKCGKASRAWKAQLNDELGFDDVRTAGCTGWIGPTDRMHPYYDSDMFGETKRNWEWVGHVVAVVGDPAKGGVYVDWTLKQFDRDAPYPAVLTHAEMCELWDSVDD
jgi:hypothetical protein